MNFLKKIAHAIDRWLASPHRALLTWAICSAVSGFGWLPNGWISQLAKLLRGITYRIEAALPFPLPGWLTDFWLAKFFGLVMVGFHPVILQVGLWRTIAWIVAWPILRAAQTVLLSAAIHSPDPFFHSSYFASTLHAIVFALPALLILGRRRPVVMILAAVVAYVTLRLALSSAIPAPAYLGAWEMSLLIGFHLIPDIAFGAVLLYGTKPIVRETADGEGES